VPVTARLSRKFYDRFGDEIANELVEWFNAVDTAYRTELREFNELNFGRFEARVEQRFAEFGAKLVALEARLDRRIGVLESRMDGLETRLDGVEKRLDGVEKRLEGVEARVGALEVAVAALRAETAQRFAEFEARIMRWVFVYWTGTAIALAGMLLVAVHVK
jgi:chromosome segregation ATPase